MTRAERVLAPEYSIGEAGGGEARSPRASTQRVGSLGGTMENVRLVGPGTNGDEGKWGEGSGCDRRWRTVGGGRELEQRRNAPIIRVSERANMGEGKDRPNCLCQRSAC